MLAAATIALVVAVDRAGDIVGTNGSARRVTRR
jgi:hypothetical protein